MIEQFPLASSNLNSGSYDDETQVLRITFATGSTYAYSGVPPSAAAELRASPEPGKLFYRSIRTAYPFVQEN